MKVKINKTFSKPTHLPMNDSGFCGDIVMVIPITACVEFDFSLLEWEKYEHRNYLELLP